MKAQSIILLITAILLSACATTDANGNKQGLLTPIAQGSAIPIIVAQTVDIDTSERSATSGDVLFTQESKLIKGFKVDQAIKGTTVPLIGVGFNITPEDELYPAITQQYGIVYCSRDLLAREAIGLRYRTCLRDSDNDERLDQLWTTDENGTHVGIFGIYVMKSEAKIETPTAYTEYDGKTFKGENLGVRYNYTNPLFGKPNISFSTVHRLDDGKFISAGTSTKTIVLDGTESFPQTLNVDGAEIEILSFEDKVITYRLKSGFKEGAPLLAIRQRAPQVTYVYY